MPSFRRCLEYAVISFKIFFTRKLMTKVVNYYNLASISAVSI